MTTRYLAWGPNDVAASRAVLAGAAVSAAGPTRSTWDLAVVEVGSGAVVGGATLTVTDPHRRLAEMRYVIAPGSWSRGYATDAASLLLRFAAERLGLRRVSATCDVENVASAACSPAPASPCTSSYPRICWSAGSDGATCFSRRTSKSRSARMRRC